ncbi:MAG: 50S ribosomal protein L17 [bacterium]|nr:50S ribosomal protein L17 [bacterium]
MRHLKKGKKFNRQKSDRRAFMKGLVSNLILKEHMETTEARAKAIRPEVEKLITIGRTQSLSSLRLLLARIPSKKIAEKLYYEIAPRYKDRAGGYTRISKTSKVRKRDGVKIARIEFV